MCTPPSVSPFTLFVPVPTTRSVAAPAAPPDPHLQLALRPQRHFHRPCPLGHVWLPAYDSERAVRKSSISRFGDIASLMAQCMHPGSIYSRNVASALTIPTYSILFYSSYGACYCLSCVVKMEAPWKHHGARAAAGQYPTPGNVLREANADLIFAVVGIAAVH